MRPAPSGGIWPCGKLSVVSLRRACLALLLPPLALAGCGGGQARSAAPSHGQVSTAFKGSPPALASLHAEANQLLGGGSTAFHTRLSGLHGLPVVVNKWGSWCGPCQSEFPAFQRASVAFGRRVAFMGIDGKDSTPAAAAFLRRFPVSYPSYVDPQENIARSIQAATYFPQTVFYDRDGHNVYDHAGPYLSAAALERDIRHYVLK